MAILFLMKYIVLFGELQVFNVERVILSRVQHKP